MKHPAIIGYEVNIWQNNGLRKGRIVKVTPKRVRIEWIQKNGKIAGCWFYNENGFIGLNCRYNSSMWGAQSE